MRRRRWDREQRTTHQNRQPESRRALLLVIGEQLRNRERRFQSQCDETEDLDVGGDLVKDEEEGTLDEEKKGDEFEVGAKRWPFLQGEEYFKHCYSDGKKMVRSMRTQKSPRRRRRRSL